MTSTINIFASGNVLSEEDLASFAQEQASSGGDTHDVRITGESSVVSQDDCVVHVVRHGKRGSHCLKVPGGSTIENVMSVLSASTGEHNVWNTVNNTFSLKVDGGDLIDDCSSGTELTTGDHTLIVSPKVAGGVC